MRSPGRPGRARSCVAAPRLMRGLLAPVASYKRAAADSDNCAHEARVLKNDSNGFTRIYTRYLRSPSRALAAYFGAVSLQFKSAPRSRTQAAQRRIITIIIMLERCVGANRNARNSAVSNTLLVGWCASQTLARSSFKARAQETSRA